MNPGHVGAVVVMVLLGAAAGLRAEEKRVIFDAPFSGSGLTLDLRSGDVEVRGTGSARIVVRCGGRRAWRCGEVASRLEGNTLAVTRGPGNEVDFVVELPRELALRVRMPAGDLTIAGIRGDKDVRLRAGDLTIDVGDPKDYGTVEASVTAGDISAPAFGGSAEGLFRTFRHSGDGLFRLEAHLWAGDLTLR